jgi:uncharacterized BrkB/YihY/UPF0761 family membrane protein
MNKNVIKDVLKKIQSEKIKQHSESFFMVKNISFWMLFVFFVLLGSLGCAVMFYAFSETEFNLFAQMTKTGLRFILSLIPFFGFSFLFCLWFLLFGD